MGTSSNRRLAQLLAYRPDLRVLPIRGNVETRIHKARAGQYDAIVLVAGVLRLGLQHHITQYLPFDIVSGGCTGQGALAVQCLEPMTCQPNSVYKPLTIAPRALQSARKERFWRAMSAVVVPYRLRH